MRKNDFSTPKAIANQIKAKGLQKLRWYCQMCEKQCRDENGFKCHCMSESHQRQMEIFGQNPNRIVAGYSEEFERLFLEHMKHSHRFSRVAVTVVYNEYIADRHHVHMNSTKWATLTEFVDYLVKTGKCKMEKTTEGKWFIIYIDPETLFKEKMRNKRIRANLADEEKQEREIKKQREQLIGAGNIDDGTVELTELPLKLMKTEQKKFNLTLSSTVDKKRARSSNSVFDEIDKEKRAKGNKQSGKREGCPVLDEIMREEEEERERSNRKDYWLCVGIIVKVMSKTGYYKQKGIVRKVIDKYVGEIEMIETKHVLRVHQDELETVIPQIGGLVRIANGAYRATNATLLAVNAKNFSAKVQIQRGIYDGKVLQAIDYEDISKCY